MKKEKNTQLSPDVDKKLKEIGAKIRNLRQQQDPNYEHFAFSKNINKVSLNRLEGGSNVTMKLVIKICQTLNISLEELFKGL
jgi:transcriptional regulator with XRE-family HTH domain